MATKKYLSLERLTEYDELIKAEIAEGDDSTLSSAKSYTDTEVAKKANSSHTHDDRYYTETEIDSKLSTINTSITNITSGTIVVKEAEHATNADEATHATSADSATTATSATKATQDGNGKVISSTYETKTDASVKLTEAKSYADSVATTAATKVKNDLLNGAGTAYDTLKELGDLIDTNVDAIEALETVASGKADKAHTHDDRYYTETEIDTKLEGKANTSHSHAISDVTGLQSALDGKANASHGTHVTFDSTNKPKMDGTAAFGTSTKVARADHVHPTDTSRASQVDLDALETVVSGKANASHNHIISDITNLQTTLDGKAAASHTHKVANITDLTATATELNYMDGVTSNVQTQLDGKAASGHTHTAASTSAAGFMTADMVTKLNGIATGANKTTVDSSLSTSSTNPVRNSVVTAAINSATSAISSNTSSISTHNSQISALQTAVNNIQEITSEEIQSLFSA